jgi:hypothetical protein
MVNGPAWIRGVGPVFGNETRHSVACVTSFDFAPAWLGAELDADYAWSVAYGGRGAKNDFFTPWLGLPSQTYLCRSIIAFYFAFSPSFQLQP